MYSNFRNHQAENACLHSKKSILRKQIRKNQIQRQKARLRQLFWTDNSFQHNLQQPSQQLLFMSQNSILQQIHEMNNQKDSLVIEQRVLAYMKNTQQLSYQFRNQFMKVCLENESLRRNPYILRSLSILVCKCQKVQIIEQINFQTLMESLFLNKFYQNNTQAHCLEEAVLFVTCLVKNSQRRQVIIQSFKKYWKTITKLGLMNQIYLQLAAICCDQGVFYLSQSEIQSYLYLQYSQYENKTIRLQFLCKIIGFYFTKYKSCHLTNQLFGFISRIFALRTLKDTDKIQVVEMIISIYQSYDAEAKISLIKELLASQLMQFIVNWSGQSNNQRLRMASILLIDYFLTQLSAAQIRNLTFSCELIDSLSRALDLSLDNNQISTILQSLILLIGCSQSNSQIARDSSLPLKLIRLQLSSFIKISQLASLLLQQLSEDE